MFLKELIVKLKIEFEFYKMKWGKPLFLQCLLQGSPAYGPRHPTGLWPTGY